MSSESPSGVRHDRGAGDDERVEPARPVSTYGSHALGIIAAALGVVGAALAFLGWAFLLPVGAIVFALVARVRESGRALWVAGLVLGILGLLASAVSLYFQVLALSVLTTLDL
ncbi:hypothetical protein QT381_00285 [Galbitalea sp. SE-J8]|uniref:hypothetical protein n=1 Tax=Galbitalea sp. SE-J8 TaxID=3054952 RepID=UPI00259C960C|nr:hypothetical protein [Galbitalea sp. SE-J8]MDM4761445.1 hypothetical protein [Galbitalea sp. SE-J8]